MKRFYFICNVLFFITLLPDKAQVAKDAKQLQQSFSFVFLSDIHLQPESHAVDGFKMAIDTINKLKPDFVISGGDQIMDANDQTLGRADSLYALYQKTSKLFKMPVYNTMGNHELYGTFSKSVQPSVPMYGKRIFEAKIGKRYQSFVHKGWKFMILDDIDETEKRKYKGYVDSVEMVWIKRELSATDTATPIVLVLHIPLITTITQFELGALASNTEGLVANNSKELLDLFKKHNLKLVLQGHLHIFENLYVHKIRFVTGGAICGWKWTGANKGTEEGFVSIKIKGNEIKCHYIDYGWEVSTNKSTL